MFQKMEISNQTDNVTATTEPVLPSTIISSILAFLPCSELCSASQVNKQWLSSSRHRHVWAHIVINLNLLASECTECDDFGVKTYYIRVPSSLALAFPYWSSFAYSENRLKYQLSQIIECWPHTRHIQFSFDFGNITTQAIRRFTKTIKSLPNLQKCTVPSPIIPTLAAVLREHPTLEELTVTVTEYNDEHMNDDLNEIPLTLKEICSIPTLHTLVCYDVVIEHGALKFAHNLRALKCVRLQNRMDNNLAKIFGDVSTTLTELRLCGCYNGVFNTETCKQIAKCTQLKKIKFEELKCEEEDIMALGGLQGLEYLDTNKGLITSYLPLLRSSAATLVEFHFDYHDESFCTSEVWSSLPMLPSLNKLFIFAYNSKDGIHGSALQYISEKMPQLQSLDIPIHSSCTPEQLMELSKLKELGKLMLSTLSATLGSSVSSLILSLPRLHTVSLYCLLPLSSSSFYSICSSSTLTTITYGNTKDSRKSVQYTRETLLKFADEIKQKEDNEKEQKK